MSFASPHFYCSKSSRKYTLILYLNYPKIKSENLAILYQFFNISCSKTSAAGWIGINKILNIFQSPDERMSGHKKVVALWSKVCIMWGKNKCSIQKKILYFLLPFLMLEGSVTRNARIQSQSYVKERVLLRLCLTSSVAAYRNKVTYFFVKPCCTYLLHKSVAEHLVLCVDLAKYWETAISVLYQNIVFAHIQSFSP
jgi:hypothetical protein